MNSLNDLSIIIKSSLLGRSIIFLIVVIRFKHVGIIFWPHLHKIEIMFHTAITFLIVNTCKYNLGLLILDRVDNLNLFNSIKIKIKNPCKIVLLTICIYTSEILLSLILIVILLFLEKFFQLSPFQFYSLFYFQIHLISSRYSIN